MIITACDDCILFRSRRRILDGGVRQCDCSLPQGSGHSYNVTLDPPDLFVNKNKNSGFHQYRKKIEDRCLANRDFFLGCFKNLKEKEGFSPNDVFIRISIRVGSVVEVKSVSFIPFKGEIQNDFEYREVDSVFTQNISEYKGWRDNLKKKLGYSAIGLTLDFDVPYGSDLVRFGLHIELPFKEEELNRQQDSELTWEQRIFDALSDTAVNGDSIKVCNRGRSYRRIGKERQDHKHTSPSPGKTGRNRRFSGRL